jgi:hypothetical protein
LNTGDLLLLNSSLLYIKCVINVVSYFSNFDDSIFWLITKLHLYVFRKWGTLHGWYSKDVTVGSHDNFYLNINTIQLFKWSQTIWFCRALFKTLLNIPPAILPTLNSPKCLKPSVWILNWISLYLLMMSQKFKIWVEVSQNCLLWNLYMKTNAVIQWGSTMLKTD